MHLCWANQQASTRPTRLGSVGLCSIQGWLPSRKAAEFLLYNLLRKSFVYRFDTIRCSRGVLFCFGFSFLHLKWKTNNNNCTLSKKYWGKLGFFFYFVRSRCSEASQRITEIFCGVLDFCVFFSWGASLQSSTYMCVSGSQPGLCRWVGFLWQKLLTVGRKAWLEEQWRSFKKYSFWSWWRWRFNC